MIKIPKHEFFSFFRQRLLNLKQIEALAPSEKTHQWVSFNPELNILLSTELDALAKYWATQTGYKCQTSEQRLGEFLARNAGPAWSKCSYLNLIRRAKDEAETARAGHKPPRAGLPLAIKQEVELNLILANKLPPLVKTPSVLPWSCDLGLDFLSQDVDIVAAGIPPAWLGRSRYGEILYRHYRCGWIHALNPDPELHTDYHHIFDPEHSPHYLLHNSSQVLAIPTEFILSSFEKALWGFEAATPPGAEFRV
jgi:hypothetical protein